MQDCDPMDEMSDETDLTEDELVDMWEVAQPVDVAVSRFTVLAGRENLLGVSENSPFIGEDPGVSDNPLLVSRQSVEWDEWDESTTSTMETATS